jgi:hypothetical protein
MFINDSLCKIIFLSLIILIFSSCASNIKNLTPEEEATIRSNIGKIMVMPVVDSREEKDKTPSLETIIPSKNDSWFNDYLGEILTSKSYKYEIESDTKCLNGVSLEDLKNNKTSTIIKSIPGNADSVLIFCLKKIDQPPVAMVFLGSYDTVRFHVFLIRKDTGDIIWQDQNIDGVEKENEYVVNAMSAGLGGMAAIYAMRIATPGTFYRSMINIALNEFDKNFPGKSSF